MSASNSSKKKVVVLGATGSVGVSTLDVISMHPEKYEVLALTANNSSEKMFELCASHNPSYVAMADQAAAKILREKLSANNIDTEVLVGQSAISELAAHNDADIVMVAIVGAIGLEPSMAAVKAGKRVLIANKEPLVMAGDLFMQAAKDFKATILPIDSEHNAIFQCLPYPLDDLKGIKRLILTASGGPFRGKEWSSLSAITPAEAIAHPNWSMGPKISVDSATMMNKGLELIEATHLFGLPAEQVDILVHPQSIIHSLVEYLDGSQLAQLGSPDMKIPIAYSLAWPERQASGAAQLNLSEVGRLDFEEPNLSEIPCLAIAKQVAANGGTLPATMNAANEVAVDAFINKQIGFTQIADVIARVVGSHDSVAIESLNHVVEVDNIARESAAQLVQSM